MIKKCTLIILTALMISPALHAQKKCTFEEMNLPLDTFWNGSDTSGGFYSADVFFPNMYNFQYDFWSGGWAVSTMRDTTTAGYTNLYSAITGGGVDKTPSYALGQQNSGFRLDYPYTGPRGVWITNTTYAALSMEQGDQFAKKFGGEDGTDPDFFLLTIYGLRNGKKDSSRTVEFYLADFRSDDSTKDYIVKSWSYVDLTSMGEVDSMLFELTSSDTSKYGYNTPLFFAIDDLTIEPVLSTNRPVASDWRIVPNPVEDYINLSQPYKGHWVIYNTLGQALLQGETNFGGEKIDVRSLGSGNYILSLVGKNQREHIQKRFIKK